MERDFGKMPIREAGDQSELLAPIEMNAMRVHRKDPSITGSRMNEALALVLHDLRAHMTGRPAEGLEAFRNEQNARLEEAILMAFDPFTNGKVRLVLEASHPDWREPEVIRRYYAKIIPGLLRIQDSVAMWTREMGSEGYFHYMERVLGIAVSGDEMSYTTAVEF